MKQPVLFAVICPLFPMFQSFTCMFLVKQVFQEKIYLLLISLNRLMQGIDHVATCLISTAWKYIISILGLYGQGQFSLALTGIWLTQSRTGCWSLRINDLFSVSSPVFCRASFSSISILRPQKIPSPKLNQVKFGVQSDHVANPCKQRSLSVYLEFLLANVLKILIEFFT